MIFSHRPSPVPCSSELCKPPQAAAVVLLIGEVAGCQQLAVEIGVSASAHAIRKADRIFTFSNMTGSFQGHGPDECYAALCGGCGDKRQARLRKAETLWVKMPTTVSMPRCLCSNRYARSDPDAD